MLGEKSRVLGIERVGAHTHIWGLGVDEKGAVVEGGQGLVGQMRARRAMHIISRMIKENSTCSKMVLLCGESGTGKTALVTGLVRTIGDVPCTMISASEIFSVSTSKVEALTQAIRKSIGISIKESNKVIEGEVVSIDVDREDWRKGSITLKTTDMEAVFNLGEKMIANLNAENVEVGDIIAINKTSNRAKKVGRSFSHSKSCEAIGPNMQIMQTPEGDLTKVREERHLVSFHEVDVINSRSQGYTALFTGETGEISSEVREQVDAKLSDWNKEGKGEMVSGILFIDEVQMLDLECFSFLTLAAEAEMGPIIILSSNRKMCKVRGSSILSPHGIPADLLDRMLVIKTETYSPEEVRKIVETKMSEEDYQADERAKEYLSQIAVHHGVRHGLNILTASHYVSQRCSRDRIGAEDVEIADRLFLSESQALALLEEGGE
jgi:RuvB-like protein 2